MNVFVDGKTVFSKILKNSILEQRSVFNDKPEHNSIALVNNYILVFDLMVRVFKKWEMFRKKLINTYNVNKLILVKSQLDKKFEPHFDVLSNRFLNEEEYLNELDKYTYYNLFYGKSTTKFIKHLATKFRSHYGFKEVEPGIAVCSVKNHFRNFRRMLYFIILDQVYLHHIEKEYLYNIFALHGHFDAVCESIQPENLHQSLYIYEKFSIPKEFKFIQCEIINLNFEMKKSITDETIQPSGIVKSIKVVERRNLETICKQAFPYVMEMSEVDLMFAIEDFKSLYVNLKQPKEMEFVRFPDRFAFCRYSVYADSFSRILLRLRLNYLNKFVNY